MFHERSWLTNQMACENCVCKFGFSGVYFCLSGYVCIVKLLILLHYVNGGVKKTDITLS